MPSATNHRLTKSVESVRSGLLIQRRVVLALMLRDPMAKHGHHGLGFFWVVGEPLLLTTGIIILWTATGFSHGHNISVASFALTGYSFITLWRHVVFRSIRAMSSSAHLAYHRQLRRIDIMIAWTLIELVGILTGFLISLLFINLLDSSVGFRDPLTTLCGFGFTALLSLSVGMLLAGLSELSESTHHLVQPIMYLTLPLTGFFTMASWLPPSYQRLMSYSPLSNCVEMIRSGVLANDVETHYDIFYMSTCCFILFSVGIIVFRYAEKYVQL